MSYEKYQKLSESPAFPYDPQVGLYQAGHMYPMPLSYYDWEDENLSWKETCAIFAGLTPINTVAYITGPDATRLLSEFTTTSYEKFPIGRMKHTIMCDDEGRILTHGMVLRLGENEYKTHTLTPYLNFAQSKVNYDVQIEDRSFGEFNFQCTGPRILEALEAASGECLHDIPFMGHRTGTILGREVRFYRMGMAGTLGYEVHGNIADARELYSHIVEKGQPFGIKRIGWQSYTMMLAEGGFHQDQAFFHGASRVDPGYLDYLTSIGYNIDIWPGHFILQGSSGTDISKRYRNPLELDWKNSVAFKKTDYRGKAALEKEYANPTRKSVTLIWNVDDVIEIQRSMFEKGEAPYKTLDLPTDRFFRTAQPRTQYQDDIVNDKGEVVGVASGRVYSLYSRQMTSLGVVNVDAEIGSELKLVWGEPGTRQKLVRVKVASFPPLQDGLNKTLDVADIPCIKNA